MGFFRVINKLKEIIEAEPLVTTVTEGGIDDVDLSKQTLFPLCHLIVNNCTISDNTLTFSVTLLAMDIVDFSSKETTDDFRGNDNEQDVLNERLAVLNRVISLFKRANVGDYIIEDDVTCEPFVERFENNLAGWSADIEITIENDMTICD